MKLGCNNVRAADLPWLDTTVHDKMEDKVETATATFDTMIRRCEDLNAICAKEDEISEIASALVQDQSAAYNSDDYVMADNAQQERHEMTMNDLEQVQRAHNTYCATL